MAIETADINKVYLSGGVANSDSDASVGGEISSVELTSNVLHNLFDLVNSTEAVDGDIEYRCFYVKNRHPTITLFSPKVWIATNVANGESALDIGVGTSAVNGVEQEVADETVAPSGVVFTRPTSRAAGLTLGNLAPGETKAIWVRRTVNAASIAVNNANASIGFGGDTTA